MLYLICWELYSWEKNFYTTERSLDEHRLRDDGDIFVEAVIRSMKETARMLVYRDRSPQSIANYDKEMDILLYETEKLFIETAKSPEFGKSKVLSFLERVVQRHELSFQEIVAALSSFLVFGVDTTSPYTMWLTLNLGRYPKVQEKLYEEAKAVVGDGPVLEQHLDQLEYMKQVIRESHRLTPTTPGTVRTLDHPITISGYEIPAGVKLWLYTVGMQTDPRIVERSDEFIPERWTKEAVEKRKGTPQEVIDAVVIKNPFGYGPRMCVGARFSEAETKILLVHLLRDWKFHFDPNHQKFKVKLEAAFSAVPYPEMTIEPRKK